MRISSSTTPSPTPLPAASPALPPLQVPPSEFGAGAYRLGEELGSGGFGRVFSCWRRDSGEAGAVKVINLRRLRLGPQAERDLENLRRETQILKGLPVHPNIVTLVDSLEESHWFYLVLELVPGGDLWAALGRRRPATERRCLREREAGFVVAQLVEGLAFLHGRNVVHRDLKPENVLVASSERRGVLTLYRVKITDFGLSKAVGEGISQPHSVVGTRRYVAPEVFSGCTYDFRVDLWSLGILLYVLLDGRYPDDQPARASQQALDAAVARLRASRAMQALVSGLLRADPGRRLALKELRTHPSLREPGPGDAAADAEGADPPPWPGPSGPLPAAAGGGGGADDAGGPPAALSSAGPSAACSADLSALLPPPPGAPAPSLASATASALWPAAEHLQPLPAPAAPEMSAALLSFMLAEANAVEEAKGLAASDPPGRSDAGGPPGAKRARSGGALSA